MMDEHVAANLAPNFEAVFARCCSSNIDFNAAWTSRRVLHVHADKVPLDELNA
tara:strand:- start:818 stop:976 length:159 start_codon:yes stop_codon:yes gene_type:complete